ncbi:hypothetical protein CBS101457_002279 [Exobasidium rhododendri]|nr:hypothetical protein CBS101457_002279 [Exobasidium rhododendri]
MTTQEAFQGWVAHDKSAVDGKLVWEEYKVKEFKEDDVELKVLACGICASDISTLKSGWGPSDYPTVVGHEIVGIVTKAGKDIKHIKVGDRVGVGAQSESCLECKQCKDGKEPYCDSIQGTYQGKFADGSGKSMGGYAKKWRGPGHFCVAIPDNLESHIAGPLMCGGATIYSPLEDYGCGGPDGKRVGIIGVGGIGAFGIAFAKALGAEQIVAISQSSGKKELAHELGATDFVAMKENPEDWKRFRRGLDIIVNTANNEDAPFDTYAWMLRPRGHFVQIAIPEAPVMPIPIGAILFTGANIGGSALGGIPQIGRMLKLAGDKKPNFMIEKRKMSDANQAVRDMVAGKPRFRYCLINEDE